MLSKMFFLVQSAMKEKGKGKGKNQDQKENDEFMKKMDRINQELFDQDILQDLLVEEGSYEERSMGQKGPPPKGKGRGKRSEKTSGKSRFSFGKYLRETHIPYTFQLYKIEDRKNREDLGQQF